MQAHQVPIQQEVQMYDERPWSEILSKIETTLGYLKLHFAPIFAEGQRKPVGAAQIKLVFFMHIWEKLERGGPFASLEELDAFYQSTNSQLELYYDRFKFWGDVIKWRRDSTADEATIRSELMVLLGRIIPLYHALARNYFILSRLNELFNSVQKFQDQVEFMLHQSKMIDDQLARLDVMRYQDETVNRLQFLNDNMLRIFREKGYGETQHQEYMKIPLAEDYKAVMFAELFKKLEVLPDIASIVTHIMDHNILHARKRSAWISQALRETFALVLVDILSASQYHVNKLTDEYAPLQDIQDKIQSGDKFHSFFALLDEVGVAQLGSQEEGPADFPVLHTAGIMASRTFGKQQKELGDYIKNSITDIIKTTRNTAHTFNSYRESFIAASDMVASHQRAFDRALAIICKWCAINAQIHINAEEFCHSLDEVELRTADAVRTALQVSFGLGRRSLPFAVSFGKAGNYEARLKSNAPLLSANIHEEVNTAYILEKLFGNEKAELVIAADPLIAVSSKPADKPEENIDAMLSAMDAQIPQATDDQFQSVPVPFMQSLTYWMPTMDGVASLARPGWEAVKTITPGFFYRAPAPAPAAKEAAPPEVKADTKEAPPAEINANKI